MSGAPRSALVTGASSGIGAGIVAVLCEAGFTVHAVARRADRLADLADRTGCTVHVADVTDSAAMAAILDGIAPDILVNNAGRGAGFDGIVSAPPEDLAATIATNVTGTLTMLRLVLPGMIGRGRGHVVNIGSVSALYPSPSAIYGGSKAAVRMISENLRLELRGTGLRVSDIRPGRVATEFYDVATGDPARAAELTATGIRELQPREIGDAVLFAVQAPAHVNVSTIEIQPLEQTYGGTGFDPVDHLR